jgi:competence protein ComEA
MAALLVLVLLALTVAAAASRVGAFSDRRGPLAAESGRPLDLNRAGAVELAVLPGIGPALARRIVEDRALRGPFAAVEDLDRVRGVGPTMLRRLTGLVTVEPAISPPR